MKVHANAALGPAGRLALVQAIESGMTQATAHRWWHRWRLAGEEQRSSFQALLATHGARHILTRPIRRAGTAR